MTQKTIRLIKGKVMTTDFRNATSILLAKVLKGKEQQHLLFRRMFWENQPALQQENAKGQFKRVLPHPQWRLRSGLSPERAGNGKPGGIQGTILTSAPLILCLVKGIHVSSVDYVKRTSFLRGELNSQSHLHKSVLNLRNKVYTFYLLIPLLYILFQVPMYNWNMNLLPTGNKIVYVFFEALFYALSQSIKQVPQNK